jgi:hypothetical protein
MKPLLLACHLLLFLSYHALAQTIKCVPTDSVTHKIKYEGVVPVANVSQAELTARASAWVASSLGPSTTVNPAAGIPAGQLIGRGTASIAYGKGHVAKLYFVMTISIRDGRYRYELTDLINHNDAMIIGMGGNMRTIPAQDSPVEEAFTRKRNVNRKGEPDADLLAYCQALDAYMNGLIGTLGKAMVKVEKDW